ncbi:transglycosylase domain-containing protein [Lacinutrix sp. C3R15]|uniref:transglycosylase domain-containing protein n=1 Tax=Flavobacteriaceae TaxID=49546 RepID=UPI001C0A5FD1|nr:MULTISPECIES: transglycosylase domain-containing protein [Flavobacteriaceae]MBU2940879.1 transglycosylase domain-containing protein [Lacinutrix sp. C3R15]MDO6624198.1 transglycosylase domain-containing protein [Oceanihabitans sp. 1_MG-2023]
MQKIQVWIKKKWIKWPLLAVASAILFVIGLYASVYFGVFGKLPENATLASLKQAEATQILDANQKLIGKYFIYDRQPLKYTDLPKHLIDALVATEDVRFYEHDGVDNISLLRVFFKTILLQDRSSGGGSTITLQLAKNVFGRKDYVFLSMLINKFKESIIAKRMENIYSKKEILTQYFNTVPFPDNTYGIESASQKFFNKSATALTISEAATLVGTLKANNSYNPRLHVKRSQARRDVVLNQMVKYNYLDTVKAQQIQKEDISIDYQSFNHDLGVAPYFREQVKKELTTILKDYKKENGEAYDIYNDGLIIHTTLDYTMQILAEEAMKEHLTHLQKAFEKSYGTQAPWYTNKALIDKAIQQSPTYKSYKKAGLTKAQIEEKLAVKQDIELFEWQENTTKNVSVKDSLQHYLKFLNTGMIAIDPETGAVKSYIGGIDYRYFKYDHISQSQRQVGSTFKPFVYTAAIENGMQPCTYFSVKPITYTNYKNWTPTNSGANEEDPFLNYNLERALSTSVNTIAVKVLQEVGIQKVLAQVKKLGIEKELPNQPSLALGVAEINIKDLAGAYASYVNNSQAVKPYYITKIEDKNGKEIASFKPQVNEVKAYSDYTRQVLLEMMKSTVNKGTASRLRTSYQLKNDIAGKTGTTQDNKDGWFVGITPKLVTINWVGNDNYNIGFKTTGMGQGANSALPIFAKFYQKLNADAAFNSITKSHFESAPTEVLEALNCNPEKRDGFIKRLFGNKKKKRKFKSN